MADSQRSSWSTPFPSIGTQIIPKLTAFVYLASMVMAPIGDVASWFY